jgi:hypothetical protein
VWIRKPVHVRLMAEQEFLASTGEKRGKADPDPAASEFAREVSRLLRTNDFTPYVELRNQFRLIELAAVLCFKKVPADRFAYLLDEHRLSQAEVPEYIGEIRREERGEVVCETQVATQTTATGRSLKSNSRLQVYHYQSRGGVEAKVQVQSADFARAETGDALVKRVLTSRPSEHSLTWTITY